MHLQLRQDLSVFLKCHSREHHQAIAIRAHGIFLWFRSLLKQKINGNNRKWE